MTIWANNSAIIEKKTRTSEALNYHPRAAVHRDAAIFELLQAFDHFLVAYKFHDDVSAQTVQESSRWLKYTQRHWLVGGLA